MSRFRIMVAGAAAVVAISAAGCGDGAPTTSSTGAGAGPVGVVAPAGATPAAMVKQVPGLKFDPTSVSVKVGDVVQWTNTDTIAHNVTFAGHDDISIPSMTGGATFAVKFTVAGSYQYSCTFHAGMTGSVTVA